MRSVEEKNLSACLQGELNQESRDFSQLDTQARLAMINQADMTVALCLQTVLPEIALVVDAIAERLKQGGRLFYVGAGTSGRLAVLDSAECPPTFGTLPTIVQSIIAGGQDAMLQAVEDIEDSEQASVQTLRERGVTCNDVIMGIAASGRTPFTLSAIKYGNEIGALTIAMTTRGKGPMSEMAQMSITPDVGPEVLSGSTRMKSGTAQKMMLGMISTSVMASLGKVHTNLMIDVVANNYKLRRRAERIVSEICGIEEHKAAELLEMVDYHPRKAILMYELKISAETAVQIAERHPNMSLNSQINLYR